MSPCIFCKIVNKEIPNYTVYEDNDVLAFLDIYPHSKGHTVVIPKKHAETIFDLPDDKLQALSLGVKQAMKKIHDALKPDGYNAGWNQGEVAGQAVPHLHFHILPRWRGDEGGSMHSIIKNPGDVSVSELAKRF